MRPPPPAPWKHISDGIKHDYVILKVHEMSVESPKDGALHPRVKIEAPDWVHVVALTPGKELILIRQFRCGVWENTLEIPGGIIDANEAPEVAALRELEEETGYRPKHMTGLGFSHPNPAIQNNRIWTFFAEGCEKVHEGNQDDGEDIAVELHPVSTLPQLVQSGAITHSLVLAGLYLASLKKLL